MAKSFILVEGKGIFSDFLPKSFFHIFPLYIFQDFYSDPFINRIFLCKFAFIFHKKRLEDICLKFNIF